MHRFSTYIEHPQYHSFARKIQGKTLEYEIYQLNLQLHTHPASHKNSALRVSFLFVVQKREKGMTSPK